MGRSGDSRTDRIAIALVVVVAIIDIVKRVLVVIVLLSIISVISSGGFIVTSIVLARRGRVERKN
jgi:hypothetical protein